jgi:predicted RNase H-like HicB family nuclease
MKATRRFRVVERAGDGSFSAFVPDLPGCVPCGDSIVEVVSMIREAIRLHLESLREHGDPEAPQPGA